MSRIGNKHIVIPAGVEISINGATVTVTGPKGTLTKTFEPCIEIKQEENILREAEEFLDSMEKKEIRQESYDKMIVHTKDVLAKAIRQESMGYLDVKELQSTYKQ